MKKNLITNVELASFIKEAVEEYLISYFKESYEDLDDFFYTVTFIPYTDEPNTLYVSVHKETDDGLIPLHNQEGIDNLILNIERFIKHSEMNTTEFELEGEI